MRRSVKIAIISVVCVVTAVAILVGALWYFGNQTDPVKVLPLSNHILGYYDDSVQYDGMVTADNIQSIYPSGTQTVTLAFADVGLIAKSKPVRPCCVTVNVSVPMVTVPVRDR